MIKKDYPQEPTDEAKVNSSLYDAELIGENDLGTVHLHGPFGNTDSNIKIAYLIGMHPMESKAHRGLFLLYLQYKCSWWAWRGNRGPYGWSVACSRVCSTTYNW